jgi:hypothetical protein
MAVTVWLNLGKSKELPDYRDRCDSDQGRVKTDPNWHGLVVKTY